MDARYTGTIRTSSAISRFLKISDIRVMTGLHNLPKHVKYRDTYKPFDYYWGLGIEHETYLQSSVNNVCTSFAGHMKPERYSVSYYKSYKQDSLYESLKQVCPIVVPVLLNAYAMTNTDIFGEHATLYKRGSPPNPKYNGKPLFDWICEHSAWIASNYDYSFVFDGDTIEFITQDFYKTTVTRVMNELIDLEARFVAEIQSMPPRGIFQELGPFSIVQRNEPWASYTTNTGNISMFNNGTFHINVTLPTRLNLFCKPMWQTDFVEKHRRLARLIQWIEPLWVCLYGSPDPFTEFSKLRNQYASGSQRLAVSRYIGLGTFDTTVMPTGKILQIPKGNLPWYTHLHNKTEYEPLEVIGLDLNFNKHWAHGIEIRIFDQMPLVQLEDVLKQVVLIMDASLAVDSVLDPRDSNEWQLSATEALYRGSEMSFTAEMVNQMFRAFGLLLELKGPVEPKELMDILMESLMEKKGFCWSHMVEGKKTCCFGRWSAV
jgi:hypothetical protein